MKGLLNRHRFSYPNAIDHSEPRLGWRDFDAELRAQGGTLEELLARQRQAFDVPVSQFADADDIAASTAGPSVQIQAGRYPHTDIHTTVTADTGTRAQDDYVGTSFSGEYASNVGPQLATRELPPAYQRSGRDVLAGYLNNPLDARGQRAIGTQFMQAPLGGHVRRGLEGVDLFGHQVTAGQAHRTEQVLAAALATGIGVPTFIAGVQGLLGPDPQTGGTMPL